MPPTGTPVVVKEMDPALLAEMKVLVPTGATGSGKSTLLRNIALQAFGLGQAVVVIEPHGDLVMDPVEGILAALDVTHLAHVAVLDVAGPCPPQLNLVAASLAAGCGTL